MSTQQRMDALSRANAIRIKRAKLKNEIADGTRTVGGILYDIPEQAAGMTIFELLTAQHRWGRSRALKLLARTQVREGKKLGELTPRQRWSITEETS